ncbi:MAG: alpha/beta hydrolase [Lysobacterales bacterium]|nr:MAG: alpha/beta hydrolase [Xanthomonadales bacterium]
MHRRFLLLLIAFLAGCASNGGRIDARAAAAGLERNLIDAAGHASVIYVKQGPPPFVVFLEGDGIPWLAGVIPNEDPTTGKPLALDMLLHTPNAGAYATRPCYHRLNDNSCTPDLWTGARYSEEVVRSIVAAIRTAAARANARSITLVGYSGGGVLAALAAERLDGVDAVITIAANLDTDAWTTHHRYLPLTGSLNPARSAREHPWREIHLQGGNDKVAPPSTTDAYFQRYPTAQRRLIADYDHVCCWINAWPELLEETGIKSRERPQKGNE